MHSSLAVDIGNTRTKFGYFKDRELIYSDSIPNKEVEEKSKSLLNMDIDSLIISSVNPIVESKINLGALNVLTLELDHKTPLPIKIDYQTPETLGKDRIAVAVGAYTIFPNQSSLVIDIGTCITYDFVSQEGNYLGGAISPGIQMRLNAMNKETGGLPLIQWQENIQIKKIGDSTISSMLSGVINGIISEINGFISSYDSKSTNLNIIITGGDATFFEKELKNGIFADPNLLLKGLNEILLYNSE